MRAWRRWITKPRPPSWSGRFSSWERNRRISPSQSAHSSADWRWLAGAVLIFANLPYTLLVILPTNKRLQALVSAAADGSTRRSIETWARLHLVRNALGLLATAAYLWAGH